MKITLVAAAFAIFILPLAVPAPAAPQDQPPGASDAQNGLQAPPPPGQGLLPGSELSDWNARYPDVEKFCGDDVVSRHICQPSVNFSQTMAERMCQSYRAGHLPNIGLALGGIITVEGLDMAHFCANLSFSTGTFCLLGGAACELSTPAPLGSKCECYLPSGPVAGTVGNQ
jgi:hypothetical protein